MIVLIMFALLFLDLYLINVMKLNDKTFENIFVKKVLIFSFIFKLLQLIKTRITVLDIF